ncbi:intradiol ring-cleavage dioxygenase [Streptomyces sp. NBC_01387]|uniref:intradiol ring-cleavage dioxygenase n=1 Tax=Streptomyces sp. NBC_01387 TaxID=2903849 RepID=UPI003249BED6
MTDPQEPTDNKDMTRRRLIVAAGAAAAAVGIGGTVAATASADESHGTPGRGSSGSTSSSGSASGSHSGSGPGSGSGSEECYRLTSEAIEGPYYIDADKIRRNITEDREGIPMTLRLQVIDADTCTPLRKAAVDIWHCDALGIYSGYESASQGGGTPPTGPPPSGAPTGAPPSGGPGGGGGGGGHVEPTDDKRYLRGTWLTDQHGYVEFRTVFPGWYQGRAVHVHTKVHVGGKLTEAGYEGGHTCHTGQFYFDEKAVLASAAVAPYATNTTQRTTLTEDSLYDGSGATGGLLHLSYRKGHIARGVRAELTMGVDRSQTHDGTDAGGGPPTASPSAP